MQPLSHPPHAGLHATARRSHRTRTHRYLCNHAARHPATAPATPGDILVSTHDDHDRQDRIWLSLIAARGRDAENALRALHDRYHKRLLRFVMHQGAAQDLAEEVVQDTFLKVWKSADSFRADAKASSWFHTIARNTLISDARRTNLVDHVDDETWQAQADHHSALQCELDSASQAAVQEALQKCYEQAYAGFAQSFPAGAQALDRVVQDRWSVRDVAAMLQRTEGATREYLSQCRKKLKRFLEPCAPLLKELA